MKKYTALLLALIIALAFAGCASTSGNEESTSQPESVSAEPTSAAVTEKATEKETVTEELITEEPTLNGHEYDFLKKGVWYLYNDSEETAYAFTFTGKDRVEIAYFDSDNTQGLDAKYFTTSADYDIKELEGDIVVEIEDPINDNEEFMFNIQNQQLCFGKYKLPNEDEVSLEIVFNHFN